MNVSTDITHYTKSRIRARIRISYVCEQRARKKQTNKQEKNLYLANDRNGHEMSLSTDFYTLSLIQYYIQLLETKCNFFRGSVRRTLCFSEQSIKQSIFRKQHIFSTFCCCLVYVLLQTLLEINQIDFL